jgi:hypothetical protein
MYLYKIFLMFREKYFYSINLIKKEIRRIDDQVNQHIRFILYEGIMVSFKVVA